MHPESGKTYKSNVLVPLVDLINTGYEDEINTVCAMNDASTHVECVATKDIEAGQEVRLWLICVILRAICVNLSQFVSF